MTPDNKAIARAIASLQAGELVAFPTETVYGLGADAMNQEAVARIFRAKQRPNSHPLIVHIHHLNQLENYAKEIPDDAWQLAEHCWPGPLTLILQKQEKVPDIVTGGAPTVGLRIPNHPTALGLLEAFGKGIAAPSANRFTRISPTTALAVQAELGSSVSIILDGGPCAVGVESTILDLSDEQHPTILRPGMTLKHTLENFLQKPIATWDERKVAAPAPGMHHLHYAPHTKTLLLDNDALNKQIHKFCARSVTPHIVCLAYDLSALKNVPKTIEILHLPDDPEQYARDLYAKLRQADDTRADAIWIQDPPRLRDWGAIHDRLFKASASKINPLDDTP